MQDSTHSHSVDNLVLTPNYVLSANDAVHSHTAGVVALTQDSLDSSAFDIDAFSEDAFSLSEGVIIPLIQHHRQQQGN